MASVNNTLLRAMAGEDVGDLPEPNSNNGKLLKAIAGNYEEWVFTLKDGTTVTKRVMVKPEEG